MSMMECFFSIKYAGRSELFEDLSVWNDEIFRKLQGTFPVIFVSFAGVKANNFRGAKDGIIKAIANAYNACSYVKESGVLTEEEKSFYDIFQDYSVNPSPEKRISDLVVTASLQTLALYMERLYSKKVLIFLDEYDTPLQEAYISGYWYELAGFVRELFNLTFKENKGLDRAIMTGITRVSKESIFSDLNNLEVVTTTSDKYCESFGFTEDEVNEALNQFGQGAMLERVRHWYDGFRFGSREGIYNPWSITKFLDTGMFDTYWANTSSNSLAGRLIREGGAEIKIAMEDLLEGRSIETTIDEEVVFDQLEDNSSAVWSLLLAAGYLKVTGISESSDEEDIMYSLALTNLEVKKEFRRMIRSWFSRSSVRYNDFIKALQADNASYMNQYMNRVASSVFSFFDTGKHPSGQSEPECFYHGFVLGLIVDSQLDYVITSNRESGLGRYDVVMESRNEDRLSYVFEFKVRDPASETTLEETVQSALNQIDEKGYNRVLMERGIPEDRIRHYGFAFEGKQVLIGDSRMRT